MCVVARQRFVYYFSRQAAGTQRPVNFVKPKHEDCQFVVYPSFSLWSTRMTFSDSGRGPNSFLRVVKSVLAVKTVCNLLQTVFTIFVWLLVIAFLNQQSPRTHRRSCQLCRREFFNFTISSHVWPYAPVRHNIYLSFNEISIGSQIMPFYKVTVVARERRER